MDGKLPRESDPGPIGVRVDAGGVEVVSNVGHFSIDQISISESGAPSQMRGTHQAPNSGQTGVAELHNS